MAEEKEKLKKKVIEEKLEVKPELNIVETTPLDIIINEEPVVLHPRCPECGFIEVRTTTPFVKLFCRNCGRIVVFI